MYNLKMLPYKMGSESARDLANLLDITRVKHDGAYVPKIGHKCINWGSSREPDWANRAVQRGVTILNKPSAVNVAANKLSTLVKLQGSGVVVPEYTTNKTLAEQWVRSGYTVVERHELRGNSGEGIRIVNLDDPDMPSVINPAPLYTKFINKTAEFRVHIFNGQVIDYIEKKRVVAERRPANFNKYVSSTTCGWVFSRTDIRDIPEVRTLAIKSVATLGLDFGAVDIVYCEGIAYVLEVNCSPGLAGTTLVRYANAFRRYMGASDLPASVTQSILDAVPPRVNAAVTAQAVTPVAARVVDDGLVTIRLDRPTALKLKQLLASIN